MVGSWVGYKGVWGHGVVSVDQEVFKVGVRGTDQDVGSPWQTGYPGLDSYGLGVVGFVVLIG